MGDAFYVDDLGRRIDLRPDLAVSVVKHPPKGRYVLRRCGRVHGRGDCVDCYRAMREDNNRYRREKRAARAGA